MGVLPGPFKIVLQGLERQSSSDTLGDPTAARVRVEVGRLFQLDDETSSNIVSAVPIVIVDGLDARAAGVVRDRLQVLRDAGCRVVITDEVTDTIPRVNWPQLPPIARIDPSNEERRGGGGGGHAEGLSCPHCGGGLQVVPAGAHRGGPPMNGREPQREPEPVFNTSAPPTPAPRERERETARPARADDDWLSPPVGASAPAIPPPSTSRRPSGRFDDAALLGYRSKPEPEPRRAVSAGAQAAPTAGATATSTSDLLDVTFSDSSEVDPPLAPAPASEPRRAPPPPPAEEPRSRRPAAPAPVKPEPESLLLDSEDDRRSKTATTTSRRPGAPEKAPESKPADKAATHGKSRVSDPFEDSLGGVDPAPVQAAKRGADPFSSQTAKRDSSSTFSSTASDPFEDSRLMDDLDLGAGGGPDPLDDSGSDILDQVPPHRRRDAPEPKKGVDARFESDLDLLDEGSPDLGDSDDERPRPAPAATPRRGAPAVSSPSRPTSSSRDLGDSDPDDDGGLSLLDSDEAPPPPPPPPPRRKEREKGGRGKGPDLDEVLNMFGPEDGAPLDDGSGLEPAPLDLSPPGRGAAAKPARAGGRDGGRDRDRGFDAELSDILEPLDPGEALEIIKTSNPKPGRRPSAAGPSAGGMNGRHAEEPSGLEQLDDGEASAVGADEPRHDKRAGAKKTRGLPFPASDEDVGLFEDSSRGTRSQKKKTDPFARARGRLAEEDEREKRSGADRAGSDRGGRAERAERGSGADRSGSERSASPAVEKPRSDPRPAKRGGGAPANGPAPSGDGEHGLVLSRIADSDKKEQAAEIIAEVKGCNLDEARRLTDRTIIPVLKGVSREVAEFHLEKFKRVKIAGRVTTRQRG